MLFSQIINEFINIMLFLFTKINLISGALFLWRNCHPLSVQQPVAVTILGTTYYERKLRQNANEVRVVFGRNVAQPVAVSTLGTIFFGR